jgi:hypothetical protein
MPLSKIISGGQTGVDRAALDAALAVSFPCGGWCPGDRSAEDGIIPDRYPVICMPGYGYRRRTRQNVVDSDGTAVIYYEALSGGTRLVRNLCALENKAYVLLDARQLEEPVAAADKLAQFIAQHDIAVLNIAGPRASRWQGGYQFALNVVAALLARGPG